MTPSNALVNDDAQFNERVKTALEELQRQKDDKNGPTRTPIRVNLNNQEVLFTDENQLAQTIASLQQERDEARERAAQLAAQSGRPDPSTIVNNQDQAPKIDMERYVELLGKDPVAAFDYVDSFRTGIPNYGKVVPALMSEVVQLSRWQHSETFKAENPDYYPSQKNSEVMSNIMAQNKIPWTSQGLQQAYAVANMNGWLEADPESNANQNQPQYEAPPSYNAPPSIPSRTAAGSFNQGGLSYDQMMQLEQMDPEQLRELIYRSQAR